MLLEDIEWSECDYRVDDVLKRRASIPYKDKSLLVWESSKNHRLGAEVYWIEIRDKALELFPEKAWYELGPLEAQAILFHLFQEGERGQ